MKPIFFCRQRKWRLKHTVLTLGFAEPNTIITPDCFPPFQRAHSNPSSWLPASAHFHILVYVLSGPWWPPPLHVAGSQEVEPKHSFPNGTCRWRNRCVLWPAGVRWDHAWEYGLVPWLHGWRAERISVSLEEGDHTLTHRSRKSSVATLHMLSDSHIL